MAIDLSGLDKDFYFRQLYINFMVDAPGARQHHDYVRQQTKLVNSSQYSRSEQDNIQGEKLQFNLIRVLTDAICGTAINNQREVSVRPLVSLTEEKMASTCLSMQNAIQWVRNVIEARISERLMFRDCLTSGIGFVEPGWDASERDDGAFFQDYLFPTNIVFDKNACSINLSDARHIFKIVKKPLAELAEEFPEVSPQLVSAQWASNALDRDAEDIDSTIAWSEINKKAREKLPLSLYNLGDTAILGAGTDPINPTQMGTSVTAHWKENMNLYRLPHTDHLMTEADFQYYSLGPGEEAAYPAHIYDNIPWERWARDAVFTRRTLTLSAFLGGEGIIGEIWQAPCPDAMMPILSLTCQYDQVARKWLGLAEAAHDSQKALNKIRSRILTIMDNMGAGYLVGRPNVDTQADLQKIADTLTDPGAITVVADINQVVPKPMVQVPESLIVMAQQYEQAIYDCFGVSKEYLGMADREQANVLELTRRQSSQNTLAGVFDSFSFYMRSAGRIYIWWIQNLMSRKQLEFVPVKGLPAGEKHSEEIMQLPFAVMIDDKPAGLDEQNNEWMLVQQVLAQVQPLVQAGQLELAKTLIEMSPLSENYKQKLLSSYKDDLRVRMQNAQIQQEQQAQARQNAQVNAQQQAQPAQQGQGHMQPQAMGTVNG